MKALVAAGGHGTRLRPITYTKNKHIIPVANKPMIYYVFENIAMAGITEVAVNINPGDHEFMNIVGDGSKWNIRITYLEQKGGALGLAHVVKNARGFIRDEEFLFYLGDNILLGGGIRDMVEEFQSKQLNCMLALNKVRDPQRFGVAEIGMNGKIISIQEKPKMPKSNLAVAGIYIYDHHVFDAVESLRPSARGEYEISDAHQYLIDHGFQVGYREITGWWKDTGQPYDLLEGNQLLLGEISPINRADTLDQEVVIEGKVRIGVGTKLVGKTFLRGPLIVGNDCFIRDSYIGPYTSVGDNVKMIKAEVEHSIILDDCEIACNKRVVNSIIGRGVRIHDSANSQPSGHTLIVGDSSLVEL